MRQSAEDEETKSLVNEIRIFASLAHPNIIDFIGACSFGLAADSD